MEMEKLIQDVQNLEVNILQRMIGPKKMTLYRTQ
jgi:hypothetical protein